MIYFIDQVPKHLNNANSDSDGSIGGDNELFQWAVKPDFTCFEFLRLYRFRNILHCDKGQGSALSAYRLGVKGFYRVGCYALKSAMNNDIAKQRLRTLEFRDRHGLEAALERSGKCRRTLYSWRRRWRERGLIGLAPESKAPRQRRRRNWPAEVIQRIRHYRELLPNLGKEQVALFLPWCKQRGLGCPGASAVGRLIGAAADNMRGSKPALTAKGKPKGYRPQRSGECVGLDAIKRRMGGLRRYILACIDEVSDYAVAMAVPQLSSQAVKRFFEACFKLTPFNIQQVITDSGGEFKGEFDQLLKDGNIVHPWTYPKTPKMNAHGERSTAPSRSGSSTATRARCSTTWLYSTNNWPIG